MREEGEGRREEGGGRRIGRRQRERKEGGGRRGEGGGRREEGGGRREEGGGRREKEKQGGRKEKGENYYSSGSIYTVKCPCTKGSERTLLHRRQESSKQFEQVTPSLFPMSCFHGNSLVYSAHTVSKKLLHTQT